MNSRRQLLLAGLLLLALGTPAAWAGVNAVEPPADYPTIQHAFLREDHQAVADLAQTFLTQSAEATEAPRVRIWLAISLDRLRRTDEALSTLETLTGQLPPDNPLRPEALYWEGDISRRSANPVRAKLVWMRLIEQYPDTTWASQARLGLGFVYVSQQAFRTAAQYFRDIERRESDGPVSRQARLLEGLCLLRLERYENAVEVLRPLLTILESPEDLAQDACYLGEALSALGRHDEAIDAYQRSLDAGPTSSWAAASRFGMGWAQFQAGRCQESIATLTTYRQDPTAGHAVEAAFAQANCFVQLEQDERAESLFRDIVNHEPTHPLAVESGMLLADLYRRQDRTDQAIAVLERLLAQTDAVSPRGHLHLRLGASRMDQDDMGRAAADFSAALDSPALEVRLAALNGLGDVDMYLGRYVAAQRRYDDVLRLAQHSPAGAYATYQQGRLKLLQGAASEAITIFYQLIAEGQPQMADDARLALASAYITRQQPEDARTQLEVIQRTSRGVPAARAAYYLALLALAEGREEDVRRLCQEAVKGASRTDEGVEARILLAELEARRSSPREGIARLRTAFNQSGLRARYRGRLAKKLGEFSQQVEDYVAAISWYALAGTLAPSLSGEASYRIAACYEEAGDIDLAISRYRAVLDPAWIVRGQLAAAKLLERQERWVDAEAVYESLAKEPIPEAKVAKEFLASLRGETTMEDAR